MSDDGETCMEMHDNTTNPHSNIHSTEQSTFKINTIRNGDKEIVKFGFAPNGKCFSMGTSITVQLIVLSACIAMLFTKTGSTDFIYPTITFILGVSVNKFKEKGEELLVGQHPKHIESRKSSSSTTDNNIKQQQNV
jgi:hypothetical protein